MKTSHMIAAALVVGFLLPRRPNDGPPLARVGELAEGAIVDGTNWTSDLWDRLQTGLDLTDPNAPNWGGTANADPAYATLAGSNMAPAWDGSL